MSFGQVFFNNLYITVNRGDFGHRGDFGQAKKKTNFI